MEGGLCCAFVCYADVGIHRGMVKKNDLMNSDPTHVVVWQHQWVMQLINFSYPWVFGIIIISCRTDIGYMAMKCENWATRLIVFAHWGCKIETATLNCVAMHE